MASSSLRDTLEVYPMVKTSGGATYVTGEGLAVMCCLSRPVFYRRMAHLPCQVHGCWRPIARRLMEPLPVGKPPIACHTVARAPNATGILQIDLLSPLFVQFRSQRDGQVYSPARYRPYMTTMSASPAARTATTGRFRNDVPSTHATNPTFSTAARMTMGPRTAG